MVAIIVSDGGESLACGGCGAALQAVKGLRLWDPGRMGPICEGCAAESAPLLVALLKLGKAEGLIETARREATDRKDVSDAFEAERRAHDRREHKRQQAGNAE